MGEELLKPAAAAQRLDMPASTLRVYSTRFAELLSEAASSPPVSSDGKPGHRLYTARDLVVLGKGKELVAQGSTYEQALEELRAAGLGVRPRPRQTGPAPPGSLATSHPGGPSLEVLAKALSGWQALAEERARENSVLRQRIDALEHERAQEVAELRDRVRRLEEWVESDPRRGTGLGGLFKR